MLLVNRLLIFRNQKIKDVQIAVNAFSNAGSLDNRFLSFDTLTPMELRAVRLPDTSN